MSREFPVVIVGAGAINFGSGEGPWNHSARLEHILDKNLKVVALIDPNTAKAESVLHEKRNSFAKSAYIDTKIFSGISEAKRSGIKPCLIVVGAPPAFRGCTQPPNDLEIQIIESFPGCAMFLEKPVSMSLPKEPEQVVDRLKDSGSIVSVGYMLRYLKVVQKMKEIIREKNIKVMATNARYIMSYAWAAKLANGRTDWFNKSLTCGPIVEQATHVCDLSRYFGGDIDLETVNTQTVEYYDEPGTLSEMDFDEGEIISPENRIPRLTMANWKYESGAVGSLMHAVALHDGPFRTEVEVIADGYFLRITDLYSSPILTVQRPGFDGQDVYKFEEDDPYNSEIAAIIESVNSGKLLDSVLSSYADAVKTYAFTWAIRLSGEQNAEKSRQRKNVEHI